MTSTRPVLRTRLSDLLGIEYPIVQSGMARQPLLEQLPQAVRLA